MRGIGRALIALATVLLVAAPASAAIEETPGVTLTCACALLVEPESGQIIFERAADERRQAASVTKIMSILLACEAIEEGRCSTEDKVNISARASGMGGSQVLLDTGEVQSVRNLLKSMIVASANDATVAMAEHLYGSEEAFVRRMNERARELGMADTCFVNTTGLPAPGQYTTARDVAKMAAALLEHALYFEFSTIWMDKLDHGDGRVTDLTNTNRLTRLYAGCDGVKTGSTNEAGYCIAASAVRGDMRLIAVVLGAPTGKERFDTAARMLDHGFANYGLFRAAEQGGKVKGSVEVRGGAKDTVGVELGRDMAILLAKGREQDVELKRVLPEYIEAPVRRGQAVGTVDIITGGGVAGSVPLVASEDIESRRFFDGVRKLISLWYYAPES